MIKLQIIILWPLLQHQGLLGWQKQRWSDLKLLPFTLSKTTWTLPYLWNRLSFQFTKNTRNMFKQAQGMQSVQSRLSKTVGRFVVVDKYVSMRREEVRGVCGWECSLEHVRAPVAGGGWGLGTHGTLKDSNYLNMWPSLYSNSNKL
jgi:hypothetical protein